MPMLNAQLTQCTHSRQASILHYNSVPISPLLNKVPLQVRLIISSYMGLENIIESTYIFPHIFWIEEVILRNLKYTFWVHFVKRGYIQIYYCFVNICHFSSEMNFWSKNLSQDFPQFRCRGMIYPEDIFNKPLCSLTME